MTKTVDPEFARKLKEKLETELIPKLQNQKIRTRTAVAVSVIALVDRQIGKGEEHLDGEWEKLRQFSEGQPKALQLIDNLKAAIDNYAQEIRTKAAEPGADEAGMRRAANGVIRNAVLAKLKALQDQDREDDAKEAAAAAEAPKPEEPAK